MRVSHGKLEDNKHVRKVHERCCEILKARLLIAGHGIDLRDFRPNCMSYVITNIKPVAHVSRRKIEKRKDGLQWLIVQWILRLRACLLRYCS